MKKMLLFLLVILLCAGCSRPGSKVYQPENYPYEPDTPAPAPHDGLFVSEHGSMRFNGDNQTVMIDFDKDLSKLTGLPEGEQTGTYVFLGGNLPPNGSFPVRYDIAHDMQHTVGEKTAVIDRGLASADGKTGQAGVNIVTPERIPMLFSGEGGFYSVVFENTDKSK